MQVTLRFNGIDILRRIGVNATAFDIAVKDINQ